MEDVDLCLRQSYGVWVGPYVIRTRSQQRKILIERWHKNSWDITFKPSEIRSSLIAEKVQLACELESIKSLIKALQESVARLQSSKQNVEEQLERVKG